MKRNIIIAAIGWLAVIIPLQHTAAQQRPNIILILADDLGYGDLGCYGQQMIRTPNIDALAAGGMRFTDYYAGCSICAPSREALLTGFHNGHTAIRGNFRLAIEDGNLPMAAGHPTIAEYLKKEGYHTALFGKWGIGDSSTGPNARGFDYSLCYMDQVKAHNYYPPYLWKNDERFPLAANENGRRSIYSHDLFADETLKYIRNAKQGEPFFLYLPYTIPHGDYMLPPDTPYTRKDWPAHFKTYATMISLLDRSVGRIVRLLKEKGLDRNTLILFTSDNGANPGPARFFQSNGVFRGAKFGLYEGGIREPFIVYWPGKIKPGQVSHHVTAAWDVLPTLCEIAGMPVPAHADGISFLPALTGRKQKEHAYLYWENYNYNYNWNKPGNKLPRNWLDNKAARIGKWKAVKKNIYKDKHAAIELYDLEKDPGEKTNVAAQHPDIVRKIRTVFDTASTAAPAYFPWKDASTGNVSALPAWKKKVLQYISTKLAKSDGGYGWEGQPDSHLTPTFAVIGILRDMDALPEDRGSLVKFVRTHHPQYGAQEKIALEGRQTGNVNWTKGRGSEAGPSGAEMRNLIYRQIRAIRWLGGNTDEFDGYVGSWKSQAGNIANYEKHKYPVLMQDMMIPVCRHLLDIPLADAASFLSYLQSRRRTNGSFNNSPASDGSDGNLLNTYWGVYAWHILGGSDVPAKETVRWVRSCQLPGGGFTHQPHPSIGGNDEVAYTWAAVKTLQLLSARPSDAAACIRYLLSLRNADGGFGNRPGLPSTPMATYYAIDALKTLDAFPALEAADAPRSRHVEATDPGGLKVFTVQFEAQGTGSPAEAVELADSLHIHLWGAKNGPAGWVEAAQRIADEKKVPVTFFIADEPYGKNVHIKGMGTFSHILDFIAPAGVKLPEIGNDPPWSEYRSTFVQPLRKDGGALLLQISNNEPLARMLLDDAVRNGEYAAISTIHFDQNFLFWDPFLYQYRYQLPFVALQDAHGTEAWWWSEELLAYRTLFLAKEPTYEAMMKALKKNLVVAVRHDELSGYKTRILGGAPGVQQYILSHEDQWKWWGDDPRQLKRPWAVITVVRPEDSLEVARPGKGVNIRIRCWRHAARPVLKEAVVTLKALRIDGRPVKPAYIEKNDRRGRPADSYYLYAMPDPARGKHTVSATLQYVEDGSERVMEQTFTIR